MAHLNSNNQASDSNYQDLLDHTPEHLQDNQLVLFFRSRYDYRNRLKQRFTPTQVEKIDSELERIERLRFDFKSNDDFKRMKESQSIWNQHINHRKIQECNEQDKIVWHANEDPTGSRQASEASGEVPSPYPGPEEDKGYGFKVYEITLKRNAATQKSSPSSYNDYSLKSYPLHDVLHKKQTNPLMEPCDENTIRYFHFPANNMLWVEEAIGRYFDEERGEYNYRRAENYRPKSSNILCREFWTAQQHGSVRDPIHARHMRSHCSFISPGSSTYFGSDGCTSTMANGSKNFVIFMPYLHWETDKRRRKMAEVIKEVTLKHREDLQKEFPHVNKEFRAQFEETVEKLKIKYGSRTFSEPTSAKKPETKPQKRHPLGQYLLHVARVYDAMDIEPDVRVLRDHLHSHNGPTLHARRTLDQSYYSKLENTRRRDQDQVVYRGTKAGKSLYRTTKVIMVDQLWLYVLDDRTIISFFPRRWGRNKPDFSGVHKGIRTKLEHLRTGEVQSVYDLALMIMNQCSTVFFDRTKLADARPQVLDIFSNAIAHMSEMKTIAFEGFWRHLEKLHFNDPKLTDIEAIEAAARVYLDVNPEGTLLREVHDITDELRMMGRIYLQQLRVTKTFTKILQALNEEESPLTQTEILQSLKKTLEDINSRQTHTGPDSYINGISYHPSDGKASGPKRPIPDGTLARARNLLEDIQIRLSELQDLEENTKEITEHLKDLLSLKQQQASIIEAKAALARADESVTQGRAIIMFTIITIIFLPLSFMSSLFGMNARELSGPDGGTMSLRHQFKFMFPISLAVIVVSLALAFSPWIRNFISLLITMMWATFAEYSGLRYVWELCIQKHGARGLYQSKRQFAAWMYGRRERKKNQEARLKAKDIEERRPAAEKAKRETEKERRDAEKRKRDGDPIVRGRLGSYGMV